MTPNGARLLLDAFQAASHIRTFSVSRRFQVYLTDIYLRSSIERQMEIVGEALKKTRSDASANPDTIRNLLEWIGLRNRIAEHTREIVKKLGNILDDRIPDDLTIERSCMSAQRRAAIAQYQTRYQNSNGVTRWRG